ncbi:zinc-dependent metalloprotease [Chitinophaga sp. GCM10012297]|uniref:Zinc-dependent metalloprotease n=1 Tax=Chitinophaga chungangae TaxID=2821488 RepID=A0ABS3YIY2_9BACT|nr:zinc-dependent metalloprotease [Chitinophaga chungangae]MBO9154651.1 zinc-dependent metalloprotease [Chitinophaga chungangae]
MHSQSKLTAAVTGLICAAVMFSPYTAGAQRKKKNDKSTPAATAPAKDTTKPAGRPPGPPKPAPKKFAEVINASAKADSGMFNIYKQDDKFFVEIPDNLLGRDVLVVSRMSKAPAGLRVGMFGFGGDQINENVIRFDKGPNNRVFLKNISFSERSKDSTQPMYLSVLNSNIQPIVASFDIKAFSKDNNGVVLDLTDYINGDNDILFFDSGLKGSIKLGAPQADKSYIQDVRSYPGNVEIQTVKTYTKSGSSPAPGMPPVGGGFATLELNSSLVLLPEVPMQPRYFDPRVGFFATSVTDFDADPQGVKRLTMITRWRLEPKPEDVEKWKKGDLVEPKKPIVFYIDPATPAKWRKYLIQGVNDWQGAFEQAGFKNAIYAKMAPTKQEDSTWSLEDARYSAIVYKPSEVPNASGPHVHDPRSGEILESHINWYHNVMRLLRNWYFIQASPNDERARKMSFDDELMGELIRFVSSHEVGHTLGLRHNFGSSSTYPVEKLRDKNWVKENGHAASIMDYARFNYVAQPGDGISGADLYPRINHYDKWAIEWGYKAIPGTDENSEKSTLNKWVVNKLQDKKYWFGTETNPDDPRSQNEDLGDDAMKASGYGLKNLQRIMPNLMAWTRTENEGYANLGELYNEVLGQYTRYMGHVAKNVGGIYETPKTVEQSGAIYEIVPKTKQKEAVSFLQAQLFTTPDWLINKDILTRVKADAPSLILSRQEAILGRLLSTSTLNKMLNAETLEPGAYKASEYLSDLKKGVFSELAARKPIDIYRRNLQKAYVNALANLLEKPNTTGVPPQFAAMFPNPTRSDASSLARAQLSSIRSEARSAAAGSGDAMTRYHLQDLADRISSALEPKS